MSDTMKRTQLFTAIVTVLVVGFASSSAHAAEGVARAKISLGLAHYTAPSQSSNTSSNISSIYPTLGVGGTYIWPSNIFADFTTRTSVYGTYNPSSITGGQLTSQAISRRENTLTVGMPIKDGIQGNVGLFTINTIFKLAQFGQISQRMNGLTAGAGKAFPIEEGKMGVVGLNGAVAFLGANNSDRFGVVSRSNPSYGISFGATYNYTIDKDVSISADAKYQSYFINYVTFAGDLSGNERILSTAVSLIAQF